MSKQQSFNPLNLSISQVAQEVEPFHVMKLLGEAKALEAQGKQMIHLEIGEPDFPSLTCVHDAVTEAINHGKTHYTPTLGLPILREKLSQFYHDFYHADVPSERILLTPGASGALHLLLTAIINPSDKVMLCDPTYPCNREFVNLLHGKVVSVPVDESSQFQLTLELIQKHWHPDIKAVMVATPSNPTGTLIEQTELKSIADFLEEKEVYLIVDEIYQGLVYERPAESILSIRDLQANVIVINSFSKFFGMTGWRLGWIVAPNFLIPTLDKLAQNLYLAASTPAQYGALRVLENDALAELENRRQTFETRRTQLYEAMIAAGFNIPCKPQGAFYLYWDVSDLTDDAEAFCKALMEHTGVVLTPGRDFGDFRSNHHIRIAYTVDNAYLKEAVTKIRFFVDSVLKNHG
ncbi:aminotransferase class I/II-fold pyridoxal phosphate-dependent enzyme [Hydrogenovibrio kuenenii]|uniref:aminotransferase class I/II-fold pyridoxal phosphate-dependent enzyme n=1 Tax=Hydrogenovibrio kuenenii TaxID=63658 RepID=UPI00046475BD|nr:aminotransferase class I/II-fold pyridoxal phosphate-dependent enzyme [Hydrogenovibrio kuenenii]